MEANRRLTENKNALYITILVVTGVLFFIPFLGRVHLFDWDEINFAESAREMIVTGNYHLVQINFEPFWEKPPFFFWLQAGAMHLFGINEFAARFPNAVFGIITLVTLYLVGRKHRTERFGFIWALAYFGSFLPNIYFKTAIIDPVFNYFIFLGIYFMYRNLTGTRRKPDYIFLILSAIFIGLATLTKGPVGLLIFLLTFLIFLIIKKFRQFPSAGKIIVWILVFSCISLLWFGEEIYRNGFWFLKRFIAYQAELFTQPVASHGEPFYYHFVVVFIGCFPISVLALPVLFSKIRHNDPSFPLLMKILFWTVMILFSLTTTKIVHYSSLTYFPLAFLAASYLDHLLDKKEEMKSYVSILIIIMGFIFSLLLAAVPYVAMHPDIVLPYIKDDFAKASLLTPVRWGGYESYIGIIYFVAVIISVLLFRKKRTLRGMLLLFYATGSCLFIYAVSVAPKIEQYSQRPAIRFYQNLAGKDVYVWPIGFKSYAQYFYGKKPQTPKYGKADEQFLLTGDIRKPAYFVTKITDTTFQDNCRGCQIVGQDGGFRFYKRDPAP